MISFLLSGQCMFAVTAIRAGDVILRESPLLVMPDEVFSSEDLDRQEEWLDRHINKLSSEQRQVYFELSDSRCDLAEDKTPLGIFYTNDMNFDGDAALFPVIARANHACVPNADFITRTELGVQELIALHDISLGEEITLCYLSSSEEGSAVRTERRDYIQHWYGFDCDCKTCKLTVRISDTLFILTN